MAPIATEQTTIVLGAPQDWNAMAKGACLGLPVAMDDGNFYPYWRASWRERLSILFGRPVRLSVASKAHPPVMLDLKE